MTDLTDEAAQLRDAMQLVPPREPGEKLRATDEAKILELHGQGVTQTDIARAVGCHQSTVSRTLAEYDDSRPLARKYLEARALEMTKRLVTDAKPETILRVLAKLDVVRDDGDRGGSDEDGTRLFVGFGLRIEDARKPPQEVFAEGDVIVLGESPIPHFEGDPPSASGLIVERKLGNAWTSFPLPCAIRDVPPFVKITPEAASFVRNGMQQPIEAECSSPAPDDAA
jgi:hypothetical protein